MFKVASALLASSLILSNAFASDVTYYTGADLVQNDYDGALTNASNSEAEQSKGVSALVGARYTVDNKSSFTVSYEQLDLSNHNGVASGNTIDDSFQGYKDLMVSYTRQLNDTTSLDAAYKLYTAEGADNDGPDTEHDYGGISVGISHQLDKSTLTIGYSDLDNDGFTKNNNGNSEYADDIRNYSLGLIRELNDTTALNMGYLQFLEDIEIDNNNPTAENWSGDAYYIAANYKLDNNTNIKPYYAVLNFKEEDGTPAKGNANTLGVSLVYTFGDGTDKVMSNMSNKVLNHWIGTLNAQMMR